MLGSAERALLSWLDDVALLERVFERRAGSDAPPGEPLEAMLGLVEAVQRIAGGQDAVERTRRGDVGAFAELLRAPVDPKLDAPLAHHLALFEGSVADAIRARRAGTGGTGSAAEREAELRAARLWASLLEEGSYLRSLAAAVGGGDVSAAEQERAVTQAALHRLHLWEARAVAGAATRTPDAGAALALLETFAREPGPPSATDRVASAAGSASETFRETAARGHARAIDAALRVLDEADRHGEAEGDLSQRVAALESAALLHAWAGRPWSVTLFVLDRATPIGWTFYKAKRWSELTRFTERLRSVVDHAAERVESDPSALPFAAPTAQHLVFRAEMGRELSAQIVDAERALALCSTHRNARLILADLLAARALATLDRVSFGRRASALATAREDVERADALWKGLPRVARARARLAALDPGGGA